MTWKARHEGSPQFIDLTLAQLRQGLVDGQWEPTDECKGPEDDNWVAIENHPQLEELAAELEPPPARTYDDETRLDMNALIDVCLVLLVFFILTTTVAALQKRLEAPSEDSKAGVAKVTKEQVEKEMILVKLTKEGDKVVVRIEDRVVDLESVQAELKKFAKATKKSTLLLDPEDKVIHEVVVKIIDAAKGAGIDKVRFVVP